MTSFDDHSKNVVFHILWSPME